MAVIVVLVDVTHDPPLCSAARFPQHVRVGRIQERQLEARFPGVVEHIGNVLERRHAYAAQLGESAATCLVLVDGPTVAGVVLRRLEVNLDPPVVGGGYE